MNKQPLVSVLVANYNNGHYIEETLESIYKQTYTNWEIVIVDDGSTDNSFEIYETLKNDSRIKIFKNDTNRGIGYTKRKCIEVANGEICAFLDPDDIITPDALQSLVEVLEENEKAVLVYSLLYECDEQMNILHTTRSRSQCDNNNPLFFNLKGDVGALAAFKKSAYEQTGGISPDQESAEDQDMYMKLYEVGDFIFLDKFLYYYRMHDKGVSSKGKNILRSRYWHIKAIESAIVRRKLNIKAEDIFSDMFVEKWRYDLLQKRYDEVKMLKEIARVINQIKGLFKKMHRKIFPYEQIKEYYNRRTGKNLSYKNPKNISEKLYWLNRYWDNPLIVQCADKYRMRNYVTQHGFQDLLVPLLGAYDDANEIDFSTLPSQFVLKCNHACGYNILCPNKESLDIEATRKQLNKWMGEVFGLQYYEYHYSKIKPKIICEEFLDFSSDDSIIDYKLHCMNGEPKFFLICTDRNIAEDKLTLSSYSLDWKRLDYLCKEGKDDIEKPRLLNEMIEAAKILSKPFPYVRLDFYYVKEKLYIGEFTFTPAGNIMFYYKDSTLNLMGGMLTLPSKRLYLHQKIQKLHKLK